MPQVRLSRFGGDPPGAPSFYRGGHASRSSARLGPVKVRTPDGGELSFFGMFASFDTPFEVTTSELAIEFLFPADRATVERLHERAGSLVNSPPRTRNQGEAE